MNDYIDRLYAEFKATHKASASPKPIEKKPWVPAYENQYEYLHAYDLDRVESNTGAKYDTNHWRYKECTEPAPWEKCWYEDWAN